MVIQQGDIFWIELDEPSGSEPGYRLARGNGGVPSAQRLPAAAACSQAKRGAARRALGLDRRRRMG
jgi:hypothetical protein